MIFLQLFLTFFKIGLFGFGGGYAMLSLIQDEVVVKHLWMSSSEFTDIIAISQMTPGPIGINAATFVGYTAVVNEGLSPAWGVVGSLLATGSQLLPSFILMFIISKFLMKYREHPSVKAVFSILRPLIIGLLASAALILMNKENFGSPKETPIPFAYSILVFLFAFFAINRWKINPIYVLVICGVAGGLFYGFMPI
ncbi:MAG: chromate transporter [Bacteroidaceae bacterium]|jgi:chromate transporter|nr:chromate transporter [Bacteroidaceae bacterium]MBO4590686.1 chromate transporter [Bacteroidaceae bacterium]